MLMRIALSALWLLAGVGGALAQNSFPTPGGATAPAFVMMCISGGLAVPCNPGGGGGSGGVTAGAANTGCPAGANLFNTSANVIGCNGNVTESDSGLLFSVAGILNLPDTSGAGAAGLITLGGARFLHDQNATSNVFLGHNASNFTHALTTSTCVGESCMLSAVSGNNNTCIGRFCMGGAVAGNGNTAVGANSMGGLTSGGTNVGIGQAANAVSTASNTTCVGASSCGAATGAGTSAFGFSAGSTVTGANNTFVGASAGTLITSTAGNTIVGAVCNGVAGLANTIQIGSVNCTNNLNFGVTTAAVWTFIGGTIAAPLATDNTHVDATVCRDTTSGQFFFGSGTAGICLGTSGRQFKRDIAPMDPVLDEIMKLDFVTYRYKDGWGDNGARRQPGLIAQDVEKVFPDLVGHNDQGEAINYDIGAVLMMYGRAVQELKVANDNLRAEVEALKAKVR
jgi:Chaperone of endosialidase